MKPNRIILSVILISIVIVAIFTVDGCKATMINSFAFHPEKGVQVDPGSLEAPVETLTIETADGVEISAFYLKHDHQDRVLLYFHGNAGNASHRLHDAERIWSMGLNVLLLDYRGYGLSKGSPTEEGVYKDAEAALSHLKEQGFSEDGIYILGRSIGSAVAVDLAQDKPFAGIILVSPFTSGKAMADRGGVGWILSDEDKPFDTISKIDKLTSPLLIVHGHKDELVPVEMGRTLLKAAKAPKQFVELPTAGHNDITQVEGDLYFQTIEDFIDKN